MTTETPEPRFERFCLAYPSGTVVMAFYADDGEVRVTHPLAVVEAVEDSRVIVGIPGGQAMNDVHAAFEGGVSARMPRSEAMEPGVPEPPALYERFTVTYPSGTVIPSFYAWCHAHRGPGHPPPGNRRGHRGFLGRRGFPRVKGMHCALQGRLGQDMELRTSAAGKDWWARQSAVIRNWRPWKHSTGPKSEEGKARVSRNPYKGGTRARLGELARLLRGQVEALKRIG